MPPELLIQRLRSGRPGTASAWGTVGRVELACFKMINDSGGINGRRVKLISLDDGYNPAKTVEQTRKLVDDQSVAFMFNSLGGSTNLAVRKYFSACNNSCPEALW